VKKEFGTIREEEKEFRKDSSCSCRIIVLEEWVLAEAGDHLVCHTVVLLSLVFSKSLFVEHMSNCTVRKRPFSIIYVAIATATDPFLLHSSQAGSKKGHML
jgi:hypothetical protein